MKKLFTAFAAVILAAASLKAFTMPLEDHEKINAATPKEAPAKPEKPRKILHFSRTQGARHVCAIEGGKIMYENIGRDLGLWEVVASEDLADIMPDKLAQYDAIVLNNTTGEIFAPESEKIIKGLIEYVKNGGAILGIHSAVDSYNYPQFRNREFTDMMGGEFVDHPWHTKAVTTTVIDDMDSPITKGIWSEDSFETNDEIYMLGMSYNRNKCRVFMRLDIERSPQRDNLRPDRDLALAYIKDFGKGRIAYCAYGHDRETFYNPKMQELMMRMTLWATGDLKADTTPIPYGQIKKPVVYTKPSTKEIEELSGLNYGERDAEVNNVLFSVSQFSNDREFAKKIEKFVYSQIKENKGTPEYRAILAELLWATGISSKSSAKNFEKLAEQKGLDEGVRGRISNAVHRFNTGNDVIINKEKAYKIPGELPKSGKELDGLITYLAHNKDVAMPEYLKLSALADEADKTKLIYALVMRGEDFSEAFDIKPQSFGMTVALAFAASNKYEPKALDAVLAGADFLPGNSELQIIANYLITIKDEAFVSKIFNMLDSATPAQSKLIVETLGKLDLSPMVATIFEGFESKSPEAKMNLVRTAGTISSPEIFRQCLKFFAAEKDKKVKGLLFRTMQKSASEEFTPEMFALVEQAYNASGNGDKAQLLSFAPMASNANALEMCKNAYREGLREPAIKALGKWKNSDALPALTAIAKSSSNQREKLMAQIEIIGIGSRTGFDGDTAEYIIRNASRPEDKASAAEIAIKNPTAKAIDAFKAAGMKKEMEAALKNLSPVPNAFAQHPAAPIRDMADGNPGTRWTSGVDIARDQWISFDIIYKRKISEIEVELAGSPNDFPNTVEVYVGDSENSLKKTPAEVVRDGSKVIIRLSAAPMAKFVKIVSADQKSGAWWSAYEVKFK